MSVKVVNIKHINELANAIHDRGLGDRRIIGQALHEANVAAYNFRYDENISPETYRPRTTRHAWHPQELRRMVDALDYQCDDQHPEWDGSDAQDALRCLAGSLAGEAAEAGPAPASRLWEYRGGTPASYRGPQPALAGRSAR